MKCEDIIEDATQLCRQRDRVHKFFKAEIKRLEHLCWKYRSLDGERTYEELIQIKQLYNTIQHLIWCVSIFSMQNSTDKDSLD